MGDLSKKIIVSVLDVNDDRKTIETLEFEDPPVKCEAICDEIVAGGHGLGHLLKDDGRTVIWRPTQVQAGNYKYRVTAAPGQAGPSAVMTFEQGAESLRGLYGGFLTRRTPARTSAAQRCGPIHVRSCGAVPDIGSHFPLTGFDQATDDMIRTLCHIARKFSKAESNYHISLHLLRYVGAPGTGKSTTIAEVWDRICNRMAIVEATDPALWDQWSRLGVAELRQRLEPWCDNERGAWVFATDFSANNGLDKLEHEQLQLPTINYKQILALRMLFAALDFPSDDQRRSYPFFLQHVCREVKWLQQLSPEHVCGFVQLAAGKQLMDPTMAVWPYDEINVVGPATTGQPNWFSYLLSEAVQLRQRMRLLSIGGQCNMVPVFVTASTRGTASDLHLTISQKAKVRDMQLPRVATEKDKQFMAMSALCRCPLSEAARHQLVNGLPQDASTTDTHVRSMLIAACPPDIAYVLSFLGSNPRAVAYALAWVSGSQNSPTLRVGDGGQDVTSWMLRKHDCPDLIRRLATSHELRLGWTRHWFSLFNCRTAHPNPNYPPFLMIFAFCMTGFKVSRSQTLSFNNTAGALCSVTMQQLEADGVIELHDENWVSGQPGTRRRSNNDDENSVMDEDVGQVNPDDQRTLLVVLSPIMLVAAHSCLEVPGNPYLMSVDCIAKLTNEWSVRELSDLQLMMLRLQLWYFVFGRAELRLDELFDGFQGTDLAGVLVTIPTAGYDKQREGDNDPVQWVQRVLGATSQAGWAYVGTGNAQNADSFLVLLVSNPPLDGCQRVLISIQSKQRSNKEAVNSNAVLNEARKVPQFAAEHAVKPVFLYVTDQHLSRNDLTKWPVKENGTLVIPVFVDKQQLMWANAVNVKSCLKQSKRRRV